MAWKRRYYSVADLSSSDRISIMNEKIKNQIILIEERIRKLNIILDHIDDDDSEKPLMLHLIEVYKIDLEDCNRYLS